MARVAARRVISHYDIMDSAYDADPIPKVRRELGHVAPIDPNPLGSVRAPWDPDRIRRYNERTTAERGNSRLKDEFVLRHLRVPGHSKAHLHIMLGVLALFADAMRQALGNGTRSQGTNNGTVRLVHSSVGSRWRTIPLAMPIHLKTPVDIADQHQYCDLRRIIRVTIRSTPEICQSLLRNAWLRSL